MSNVQAIIAARVFMGADTIFRLIPDGGKFRFASAPAHVVCTKTGKRGWYVIDGNERKFRTGLDTAVCFAKGEITND